MMKKTTPMFSVVKIKESEDTGETKSKVYTFIAGNTLPDRARVVNHSGEKCEGEILSKNVLDKAAKLINSPEQMGGKYGSYRTVSLFHDRVYEKDMTKEEAGFVHPGSAVVRPMENSPGNFELLVDVEVNEFYQPTTYPDYTADKIHYKIEKDALGLSYEYNNEPHQERTVEVDGKKYNYVLDTDDFRGFGFARPNLIGNVCAVRVKEINLQNPDSTVDTDSNKNIGEKQMEDAKTKEMLAQELASAQAKIKEFETQLETAKQVGSEAKVKELQAAFDEMSSKVKELELKNDDFATKIKESLELGFSSFNYQKPAKTKEDEEESPAAKVKEVYSTVAKDFDFVKFKEQSKDLIEQNATKIKELFSLSGPGFDFEKWQTFKVKCKGSNMIVVPGAKTKDVLSSASMAEGTYSQTNAMFADRYVAGITETFLKEDSFLSALPKEQHMGGNDKYQWKLWVDYTTVTGTNTLAVDPLVTSVQRTVRKFEKMETRICEYRDGVEVTDFAAHHSMAVVGDLLGIEIQRAAEAVTESMNADLFKGNTEATAGWEGFVGLIGYADSSTYGTLFGKTRSAANRLLDATLANTYNSTSEGISSSVIRAGYNKVLAHGSSAANLAIVIHPTQFQKLLDQEDASIRHPIVTNMAAPPKFGFNISMVPFFDGVIPMILDYRCESSAAAADMFAVVDLSPSKGANLVVSKPLGVRGLAKVGTTESAYVNFYGAFVYKSPLNVFVHVSLT